MGRRVNILTSERLKGSRDRKVSPMGRDGGIRTFNTGKKKGRGMVATINNSFGIPAGISCPGKTEFCESCYAVGSENVFPNVGKAMRHNWDMLARFYAEYGIDGYEALLDQLVGRFEHQIEFYDIPQEHWIFRIHWDGDFFSEDYAQAWANVMGRHSQITFWAYTRSFVEDLNVVPILVRAKNLSLYLSADPHNIDAAMMVTLDYPQVRLALCDVDYDSARSLVDSSRSPIPCPENIGTIPLINDEGVGACVTCKLCIRGNRDIMFTTSHQQSVEVGVPLPFGPTTKRCKNPECSNGVPFGSGPGRKKEYCDRDCQLRHYNKRRASKAEA